MQTENCSVPVMTYPTINYELLKQRFDESFKDQFKTEHEMHWDMGFANVVGKETKAKIETLAPAILTKRHVDQGFFRTVNANCRFFCLALCIFLLIFFLCQLIDSMIDNVLFS
jgi:hypothetical protein